MIDSKSKFSGKNCLATGGAGFIGSNLSRYQPKIGAKVLVIDDFSTGKKDNTFDFEELASKSTIEFYERL